MIFRLTRCLLEPGAPFELRSAVLFFFFLCENWRQAAGFLLRSNMYDADADRPVDGFLFALPGLDRSSLFPLTGYRGCSFLPVPQGGEDLGFVPPFSYKKRAGSPLSSSSAALLASPPTHTRFYRTARTRITPCDGRPLLAEIKEVVAFLPRRLRVLFLLVPSTTWAAATLPFFSFYLAERSRKTSEVKRRNK